MLCPRPLYQYPLAGLVVAALCALVLLLAPSCATQQHQKASALVDYVNSNILALAPIEARALEDYAAVTGENYKDEQVLYQALEERVIPMYEQFYRALRNVPIDDPEIGRLHSLYIRSADMLLDGFRMKRLALETNDLTLMHAANTRIEQGRDRGYEWRAHLEELTAAYGVREEK